MMIAVQQRIVHVTDDARIVGVWHAAEMWIVVHTIHAWWAISDISFGICVRWGICVISTADFIIIHV